MRLVVSDEARSDPFDIWVWNEARHGIAQADRDLDFRRREAERIAADPEMGQPVEERPGLRYATIRWRAGGYGHLMVYALREERVLLVKVFHTAQEWRVRVAEL